MDITMSLVDTFSAMSQGEVMQKVSVSGLKRELDDAQTQMNEIFEALGTVSADHVDVKI